MLSQGFNNQGNMDARIGGDLLLEPGDTVDLPGIYGCQYTDNIQLKFADRNPAYAADPTDRPFVVAIRTDIIHP